MTLAVDGIEGTHEFLLIDDFSGRHGQWIKTNSFETIEEGKLFAPGNLRAAQDNPGYSELLDHYYGEKYQLRYTGGMVPDVNQLMVKGKGIFVNPASPSAKAKLRVLYEVAPIGYLIEKAGGKSSDGEKSVLDIEIVGTEDRSQVAYGSAGEVERFEKLVGRKYVEEPVSALSSNASASASSFTSLHHGSPQSIHTERARISAGRTWDARCIDADASSRQMLATVQKEKHPLVRLTKQFAVTAAPSRRPFIAGGHPMAEAPAQRVGGGSDSCAATNRIPHRPQYTVQY
eukprot:scaffold47_cov258-Pinguiococcus_pyrenoidosus.AAC.127